MSLITEKHAKKIRRCMIEKAFDKYLAEYTEKIESKEKLLLSFITDEYIRIITLCKSLENLQKPISELKTLNNNIDSYFNELHSKMEHGCGELNEIEQALENISNIKNILRKITTIIKISEEKETEIFYTVKNIKILKENIEYLYESPFYSYFYDIYNDKKYSLLENTKINLKEWCRNIFNSYETYGSMILDNMNDFEYKFGEEVNRVLDESHYIMLNSIFKEGISKYYLIFDKKYFIRKNIDFQAVLKAFYIFGKLDNKLEISNFISKELKNTVIEEISKEEIISKSLADKNEKSIKFLKICLGYEIVNFYLLDVYEGFEYDETVVERIIERGVDSYFYTKIIDFNKYFKNNYKEIESKFKDEFYNYILNKRTVFNENMEDFYNAIGVFVKESNQILEGIKYKEFWDFYLKNLDDIFYEKIEDSLDDHEGREKVFELLKQMVKRYAKYKFQSYMLVDRIYKDEITQLEKEYNDKTEKILLKNDFGDNLEEIYKELSLRIKEKDEEFKNSALNNFLIGVEYLIDKIENKKDREGKKVIFLKFKKHILNKFN